MRSVLRKALWPAWVVLAAVSLLYPIVSGRRPLDWWALIDVVAFALIACGASFLIGRSVERRAMRRKIEAIMDSVDVMPMPPMLRFSEPLTHENAEAIRKRFEEAYRSGGVSHLGTQAEFDVAREARNAEWTAARIEIARRFALKDERHRPSDES